MSVKEKRCWAFALVLFALFVAFTISLSFVDVNAIGPKASSVGYSPLNQKFANLIGVNDTLYKVSEILGYVAILIVIFAALRGFIQLLQRKSLIQVDLQIFMLGLFLIVLLIFYVMFEFVPVNFRPVLEDGELASSYPSSHTMLAIFVFLADSLELKYSIKKKSINTIKTVTFYVLAVLTITTRVLSGFHWVTDIVGAVLLALSLVLCYKASLLHFTVGENK